jgi:membrane fusion protein (multidrug efflux system)
MSEKRKKILGAVGAVILVIAGYFVIEHVLYVSTDNAQIDANTVMLAAKLSGYITKVNVDDGQVVKKDDVLVEIDSRDYENAYQQLSNQLVSIDARRKDAEKNLRRISVLYDKGAVSQAQYDSATAASAEVKAQYEALAAQVAQAQLNLENTKLRAPSDGIIARKSAEVGQLASPGVPLIGFVSSDGRWVMANFKETELEDIKIGSHATIDVDAIGGKTYHGEVIAISPATGAMFTLLPPDNATGNFTKVVQRVPVKIKINDIGADDLRLLRAGLSVVVKVRK